MFKKSLAITSSILVLVVVISIFIFQQVQFHQKPKAYGLSIETADFLIQDLQFWTQSGSDNLYVSDLNLETVDTKKKLYDIY